MKKLVKRLVSLALTAAMVVAAAPAQAFTPEIVYLPEVELEEDILNHDVFYLATTTASVNEGGNAIYLLRVGRGGDAEGESTALVKIADMTARYGTDYTVRVRDRSAQVDDPEDNYSLAEQMEGSDFVQSEVKSEEELAKAVENDPEARAAYEEGVKSAVEFLEDNSGLSHKYGDQDPYAQALGELYGEDAAAQEIPADTSGETIALGDGAEAVDPVQAAANLFTGQSATAQRLTNNGDMFQDLQAIANVLTNVVVGASVELTFAPGEKEKYLEIVPKDNLTGDGDRMFYIMLGAPRGATTNSAASTCAVTIVDDEEQEPAMVSFSAAAYTHTPGADTVTVTVEREGAINTVISATVRTTGEGTAQVGRDYSRVDRTLFFPFGVSALTVDIPVRTGAFTGEADFGLELVPDGGCALGEISTATVYLTGTGGQAKAERVSLYDTAKASLMSGVSLLSAGSGALLSDEGTVSLLATTTDRTNLSATKTGGDIKLSSPLAYGHADNYWGGDNGWTGDSWKIEWRDNTKWRQRADCAGALWGLTDEKAPYWLSGAQVKWLHGGGHGNQAWFMVYLEGHGLDSWDQDWSGRGRMTASQYDDTWSYRSPNRFGTTTMNIFPTEWMFNNRSGYRPVKIGFYNKGSCDDCDPMHIYSIKPILRPFQINLREADKLTFLKADGTRSVDDGSSVKASLVEAGTQMVTWMGDSFTVAGNDDSNTNQYCYVSGIDWVTNDAKESKILRLASNNSAANNAITYDMTKENINYLGSKKTSKFKAMLQKLPYPSDSAGYSNVGYGTYAQMYVKPVFDYIDASVTLTNPYPFPVTYTISGTSYTVQGHSEKKLTYHLGDHLQIRVAPTNGNVGYTFAGVKTLVKGRTSDKEYTRLDYGPNQSGNIILGTVKDKRLCFQESILEPLFQENGNEILLRVATSSLSRFDRTVGVLSTAGTPQDDGYTYYTVAQAKDTVAGRLYAINAPARADSVSCFVDPAAGRQYIGDTFYFYASDKKEENIITLKPFWSRNTITLSGTLHYMDYNLRTLNSGGMTAVPAKGVIVAAGAAGGVTDGNGYFKTGGIKTSGWSGNYLRYLVSVNGSAILKEVAVPTGNRDINVSGSFSSGLSAVTSEIFDNIHISGTMRDPQYQILHDMFFPIVSGVPGNLTVKLKPVGYTTFDGVSRTENPTKIQLVVYDANGNLRWEYDPVTEYTTENNFRVFRCQIDTAVEQAGGEGQTMGFSAHPGDKLYLRLTTDRLAQTDTVYDANGLVINGQRFDAGGRVSDYQYSDLYTGISFYQPVSVEVPPDQTLDSPVTLEFATLPLLGTTGLDLNFPFLSVSITRIDKGYRMSLGVGVTDIIDKIKGTHLGSMSGDKAGGSGEYWKSMFSAMHPFDSFHDALSKANDEVDKVMAGAMNGNPDVTSGMGAPTWSFTLKAGVYFDFYLPRATGETNVPTYVFAGVGGFMTVNLSFKVAWYFLIPVVFIPAYFGIELGATVMGWIGAKLNEDPKITYDQARKQSVNFGGEIDQLTGGVRASGMVQLSLGVGLMGTIGVRLAGRFNVIGNWEPSDVVDDFGAYLALSAGIIVDLLLFSVPLVFQIDNWPFGSFAQYANAEQTVHSASLMSVNSVNEPSEGLRLRQGSGEDSQWVANAPRLMAAFTPESTTPLVQNAYERPDSQLLTLSDGQTVVLAFLDSDNAKGEYQRTTLKLALYDGSGWSDPVIVSDDATADFQPSIAEMRDGRLLVAWTSPSGDLGESPSALDYLQSMDVYSAFVTLEGAVGSKTIKTTTSDSGKTVVDTAVTRLSKDTQGYYDSNPTVVCDPVTGDAAVYYVKSGKVTENELDLANPYTNDSVICYMLYNAEADTDSIPGKEARPVPAGWLFENFYYSELDGDATKEAAIKTGGGQRYLTRPTYWDSQGQEVAYAIPDLTAIGYDGLAVYAYTVDTDGSNSTDADKELYLNWYDFRTHKSQKDVRITEDSVADAMPQFFRSRVTTDPGDERAHTKLFWYRDGKQAVYIDVTALIQDGIDQYGLIKNRKESSYATPSAVGTVSSDNRSAQMADFRVVEDSHGSLYVVWSEAVTNDDYSVSQEIFAMSLLSSGDNLTDADAKSASLGNSGWSKPYQLTRGEYAGKQNDEIAVALSGQDLMVVHNQYQQTLNLRTPSETMTTEVTQPTNEVGADGKYKTATTQTTFRGYSGRVSYDPVTIQRVDLMATKLAPCGSVEAEDISLAYKAGTRFSSAQTRSTTNRLKQENESALAPSVEGATRQETVDGILTYFFDSQPVDNGDGTTTTTTTALRVGDEGSFYRLVTTVLKDSAGKEIEKRENSTLKLVGEEIDGQPAMVSEITSETISTLNSEDTPVTLPEGGSPVVVSVTVSNNGLTTAKGYKVELYAVDKGGNETKIGEKLSTTDPVTVPGSGATELRPTLIPNTTRTLTFDYTLPPDVDGLSFKAITTEMSDAGDSPVYYNNSHTFNSEPLEARADYAISDVIGYQDEGGVLRARFTLTNNGNAESSDQDTVLIRLNGPSNLEQEFEAEDRILCSDKINGTYTVNDHGVETVEKLTLGVGQSVSDDVILEVKPEMMKKFGFITATVSVVNEKETTENLGVNSEGKPVTQTYTDTVTLGETKEMTVELVSPMNMELWSVEPKVGESKDIEFSMELGEMFGENGNDVTFTVGDPSVATIEDGKVVGLSVGRTTLYATHTATGTTLTSYVTVEDGEDGPDFQIDPTLSLTVGETGAPGIQSALSGEITWESGNTGVASVDASGVVRAAGAGTATITATLTEEGGNIYTSDCVVTVSARSGGGGGSSGGGSSSGGSSGGGSSSGGTSTSGGNGGSAVTETQVGTVVESDTKTNRDGSTTTKTTETTTTQEGSKSVTTTETTEKTSTNRDGSVTETQTTKTTTVDTDAKGQAATTETTSTTETTTSKKANSDGSQTETVKTVTTGTETTTDPSGAGTKAETRDESTTTTTSATNPDGSATAKEETQSAQTVKTTVTDADGDKRTFTTETKTDKSVETTTGKEGRVTGSGTLDRTQTVTYADGTRATEKTQGIIQVTTDEAGTVREVTTSEITATDSEGNTTQRTEITTAAETAEGTTGVAVEDGEGHTLHADATVSREALETALKTGEPIHVPLSVNPDRLIDAPLVNVTLPAWDHRYLSVADMPRVELDLAKDGPGIVAYERRPDGFRLVKECYQGSLIVPVDCSTELLIADNTKTFSDLKGTEWYAQNVTFVTAREIFNGQDWGGFQPESPMNRAMVAQVIYNLDRNSKAERTTAFNDVKSTDWWADAIGWANKSGIVTGYEGGFHPTTAVTRQDLVTILYRYAKQAGYDAAGAAALTGFSDGSSVAGYAREAMGWAVSLGVLGGFEDGTLRPEATATRAQVAAILERFIERVR